MVSDGMKNYGTFKIIAGNEDEKIEIEDSNGVIDYYDVWSMDNLKQGLEEYISKLNKKE